MPLSEIPLSKLPESFDWRDVNGVNFVSPVRDQGHCGSCYTVATVESFEARRRIKYANVDLPLLSV